MFFFWDQIEICFNQLTWNSKVIQKDLPVCHWSLALLIRGHFVWASKRKKGQPVEPSQWSKIKDSIQKLLGKTNNTFAVKMVSDELFDWVFLSKIV